MFQPKNFEVGISAGDELMGWGVLCAVVGLAGSLLGASTKLRIFDKGYTPDHQWFCRSALCQPQIRSCERPGRSDQGQRRRLGLHPFRPAG